MAVWLPGHAAPASERAGEAWSLPAPTPFDRDRLAPLQLTLYAHLGAGWVRADRVAGASDTIASAQAGKVGLRGYEQLSGGYRAYVDLEAPVRVAMGDVCTTLPIARASIGLGARWLGRLDIGTADHASRGLLLEADPWLGAGPLSPGDRLIPLRADTAPDTHRCGPTVTGAVSRHALTWRSPEQWPLRAAVQSFVDGGKADAPSGHGGALYWDRKPWLLGIAWSDMANGARALPLVLVHDSGTHRLALALSQGRVALANGAPARDFRNSLLSWSMPLMAKGDPQRHEFRAAFNKHRFEGAAVAGWEGDDKWSLGWRYRLSSSAWLGMGGARVRPDTGPARWAYEATLNVAFERNLRLPQWPR